MVVITILTGSNTVCKVFSIWLVSYDGFAPSPVCLCNNGFACIVCFFLVWIVLSYVQIWLNLVTKFVSQCREFGSGLRVLKSFLFIEKVETIAEIDHLQSVPCFINASAILEQVANLHASLEKFKMAEALNSSRSRKILIEEKIIVSVTCHLTFNLLYLA